MARPFPGHPWHRKADADLIFILKDAGEAAHAANSIGDPDGESKYIDQIQEALTILQYRRQAVRRAAEITANLVPA